MAEKKRILVVAPRPMNAQAGGITRMVSYFGRTLEMGDYPFEISFCPTRLTEKRFLNHLSTPLTMIKFMWILAFGNASAVHIHVAPGISTWRKSVFARVATVFRKPIVLHLHGSGYDEYFNRQSAGTQRRLRAFFALADGLIVLGAGWRRFAIERLGVDENRVHIIDNGVPDPKECAERNNAVPRIVFIGSVGRRKGIDILLEALAKLPAECEWTCAICGNGEISTFQAQAQSLNISPEKISFKGWLNEEQVREQLKASDIFVLPSRAENQPVAILEAMALSLPVISTLVGDIPNQVTDGVTGYVVPRADTVGLSAALLALILNPDKRITYGNAGRKRYETDYSIISNLTKTLALYDAVIKSV